MQELHPNCDLLLGGGETITCLASLMQEKQGKICQKPLKEVKCCLKPKDLQPAEDTRKSSVVPPFQMSVTSTADVCLVSDTDGQRTHWVEYIVQL